MSAPPAEATHGSLVLQSAFQPIVSLAHGRTVGHEALLRASSVLGESVAPREVYDRAKDAAERRLLDRTCLHLHAKSFARQQRCNEWLFLNVDVGIFECEDTPSAAESMCKVCADSGLMPQQIVIEVLEDAFVHGQAVESQVAELKAHGFLIALDDFGAGHSNFDRVFKLAPTIVKLDRGVLIRALQDPTALRVATQMVSLLHECGSFVVMEGIERREEALVALDSGTDFAQGYYFGRPSPAVAPRRESSLALSASWRCYDERGLQRVESPAPWTQPYALRLHEAVQALSEGRILNEACADLLALANSNICYLLDSTGRQLAHCHRCTERRLVDPFAPLSNSQDARWSRQPYFRRSLDQPGRIQVTRPYLTLQNPKVCVTMALSFGMASELRMLCIDVVWDASMIAAS